MNAACLQRYSFEEQVHVRALKVIDYKMEAPPWEHPWLERRMEGHFEQAPTEQQCGSEETVVPKAEKPSKKLFGRNAHLMGRMASKKEATEMRAEQERIEKEKTER